MEVFLAREQRRRGDPGLTRESTEHIVLRKDKVEIGNLAEQVLSSPGRRMSLDVQEA
jgi:hypothetical protein